MYTAWSVVFGELPTTAKWNQLGQNDAGFRDGTNFDNDIFLNRHFGAREVTPEKISDMAWEIIGSHTLASAADLLSVTSLPARKFLKVIVIAPNSGEIALWVRFNNDSGASYAIRRSASGAADTTNTAINQIYVDAGAQASQQMMSVFNILNIANREKIAIIHSNTAGAAGAANIPTRGEGIAKWNNSSDQINRIDVVNPQTGDFAAGSQLLVFGSNGV